jgi:hypothetical protein
VRESGEKAGVQRKGRWLRVGHAVLCEDFAHVFGLVKRDCSGRTIAGDVHAHELGEVA